MTLISHLRSQNIVNFLEEVTYDLEQVEAQVLNFIFEFIIRNSS